MPKEKFMDRLRTYGMSIKVPLTGLVIAVAILPLFLQAAVMLGSFNQGQLDARTIEIQNQCVILSNKMTRSGYMTAEKKNATGLDSQMQAIADVYNGRIVIVNTNFRVVTDTFNLATGKYYSALKGRTAAIITRICSIWPRPYPYMTRPMKRILTE